MQPESKNYSLYRHYFETNNEDQKPDIDIEIIQKENLKSIKKKFKNEKLSELLEHRPYVQDAIQGIINVQNSHVNQKAAQKIVYSQITNKKRDLNLYAYNLKDLSFLNQTWNNLEEINISKNYISDIKILNNFQNITVIDASNNYIHNVALNLNKLQSLNLQGNYIEKYPEFRKMLSLNYLNLNANQIRDFKDVDPKNTPYLTHLEIQNNSIQFEQLYELNDFFQNFLSKLIQLQKLDMSLNPFLQNMWLQENNLLKEQIQNLTKIQILNGQQISRQKNENYNYETQKLQKQGSEWTNQNNDLNKNQSEQLKLESIAEISRKEEMESPSLPELLDCLYKANNNPDSAFQYIQSLSSKVDILLINNQGNEDNLEQSLSPNLNDEEIYDQIETFMQNIELLIDNHPDLRSINLTILAKLCVIKYKDFGLSCFNTMRDLMKAGREIEEMVTSIFQHEVINKINQRDPKKISEAFFKGLFELVEDTKKYKMIQSLLKVCLPNWLGLYCHKLESCRTSNIEMGNDDHYDIIIKLLSLCSADQSIAIQIIKQNLIPKINQIIMNSQKHNKRYILCLQLIAKLSSANIDEMQIIAPAEQFIDGKLHLKLIQSIDQSLNSLDFNSFSNFEVLEKQYYCFKVLAQEIYTLGNLLYSQSSYRKLIIDNPISKKIVSILGYQKNEPMLLSAACQFAINLFSADEIRNDKLKMESYFQLIQYLKNIMPFILQEQFIDFYIIGQSYQILKRKNMDQKQIEIQFYKFQDEIQQKRIKIKKSEFHDESLQDFIKTTIQQLDDAIIKEFYISFIQLISFFSQECQTNKQNYLFKQLSQFLNENGREKFLFQSLAAPDDEVKYESIVSLYILPSEYFDLEEINHLTNILFSFENISAGQNEYIISLIFLIFAKLVAMPYDDFENTRIFQNKFGEKILNFGLQLLQRNLERIISFGNEEEDFQKYFLSSSIINFLKQSSVAPNMQKYMTAKNQIFKKIIMKEEMYSSEQINDLSIDIETTHIGSEINCLIEGLSGLETLQPFSNVSLRVIMRMADVLMGKLNTYPFDLTSSKLNSQIGTNLINHQKECHKIREEKEKQFWVDMPITYHQQMNQIQQEHMLYQHYNFTRSNGIALIKNFLLQQTPINEEIVFLLSDPVFLTKQKNNKVKLNLYEQLLYQTEKMEGKFKKKYMDSDDIYKMRKTLFQKLKYKQEQNKNKNGQTFDSTKKKQKNWEKNCKKTQNINSQNKMQIEEIAIDYDISYQVNYQYQELLVQDKMKNYIEEMKKQKPPSIDKKTFELRNEGIQNQKIRTLTIAAFLRCIYASIEFAPDTSLKESSIKNVRDPIIFKSLTQLCESTHWDDSANITSKYLKIARYVIMMSPLDQYVNIEMSFHFQIVSIIIQKSLQKIYEKIKNDIELSDSDRITHYEVSITMFMILQQSFQFQFSSLDIVKQYRLSQSKITPQDSSVESAFYDVLDGSQPLNFKCDQLNSNTEKHLTYENFYVNIQDLTKKRSIQDKMVDFTVMKLFKKQTVYQLIDILFKDMQQDRESLIQLQTNESQKEENDKIKNTQTDNDFGYQMEEYVQNKNICSIERIKDTVGEIMSFCKSKMEFEIVQYIMESVTINQKYIRESFLQEIIAAADNANYRIKLQKYMNANLTQYIYPIESFSQNKQFRIVVQSQVDINQIVTEIIQDQKYKEQQSNLTQSNSFIKRIFVLTNQGISILKNIPESIKCEFCSSEKFCPRGPIFDYMINYKALQTIVIFPQIPQKFVLKYKEDFINENGIKVGVQYKQITVNVKTLSKASKIILILNQIINKIDKKNIQKQQQDTAQPIEKLNLITMDLVSQYEFRNILKDLEIQTNKQISNEAKYIYASIIKTDIVSKAFFKKFVETKDQEIKQDKMLKLGEDLIETQLLKNSVLISILNQNIIILKEKWENWSLLQKEEQIRFYKRSVKIKKQNQQYSQSQHTNANDFKPFDDFQKQMIQQCLQVQNNIFHIVGIVQLKDIHSLIIHKGSEASIEIKINNKKQAKSLVILFPGDQERMMFLDKMWQQQNEKEEIDQETNDFVDSKLKKKKFQTPGYNDDEQKESDKEESEYSEEDEIPLFFYD